MTLLDQELGAAPDPAVAKLADLAHERHGVMSDVQQARGLQRAVTAMVRRQRQDALRFSPRFWLASGALATAVCLVVLLVGRSLLVPKPLGYAMRQGEIQAGGYFRAGANARPSLEFSDGTRLDLESGARGRIATVDAVGARIVLDEGEAHVQVVPRRGARWLFDAGPFLVRVQGTEFQLAWRGDEGRLDVRLDKGAVSVTGPVSDQAIALVPGQWLTVRLAAREVFVRDFDRAAPPSLTEVVAPTPAPAVAPTPAVAPAAPEAPSLLEPPPAAERKIRRTAHAAAASEASMSSTSSSSWAAARAEGDWARILDLAQKRGIDRTLGERSSEDLALLADAAHYLHHDDLAEQALLAQRHRFPGSTRAKDAAFLLGRIVEAKSGGADEALTWYDRHLEEAPGGAYASEALGRKMTVLARLRGAAAARPVAEEYLRRYPGGTYARAAHAFVSKP